MENEENKDLQGRREFFKEAAKKALPLFAVAVLGPNLLSSCRKDNYGGGSSSTGCGNSCSGSCKTNCSGSCEGDCAGDCDDGCYQACIQLCTHYQL